MGVSIHYRSQLADTRKIKALCLELALVAGKMGWVCTRVDENWSKPEDATIEVAEHGSQIIGHLHLKAIVFTINSKCEPLWFFFDSQIRRRIFMNDIMYFTHSLV
jgi:hypothetical protein